MQCKKIKFSVKAKLSNVRVQHKTALAFHNFMLLFLMWVQLEGDNIHSMLFSINKHTNKSKHDSFYFKLEISYTEIVFLFFYLYTHITRKVNF